jgi:FkbM family methyltransferase
MSGPSSRYRARVLALRNRLFGLLGRYLLVAPHRFPPRLRVLAYRLRNVGLQEWPVQGIAQVPGVGSVACDTADYIQRYLYLFGVWEPAISELMRSRLGPGQVFVDVGANIGYYSLLAANAVGDTGNVIAFEPSPTVRSQLEANIARNGLGSRITVQPVAAGEADGTVTLFLATPDNLGQTSTRPSPGFTSEGEVAVRRVDDCVPEADYGRVAFMKVDTEGDELAAVRGAQRLLAAAPAGAMVLIELDEPRMKERGAAPAEVFALMAQHGYRASRIRNDYDVASYVHPGRAVLEPLTGVVGSGDVVFVREEAAAHPIG